MPARTRKVAGLRNVILANIYEQFIELKSDFLFKIKNQIKNKVSEAIGAEIRKREELKWTVAILQQFVKKF